MKPTDISWQQQVQDEINRRNEQPKQSDKEKMRLEMEKELKRLRK
jgi:hypothetical protein